MGNTKIERLFKDPEDFAEFSSGRKSSVHYGQTDRIDKAREQARRECASMERVAELANEALEMLGIAPVADPIVAVDAADIDEDGMVRLDYDWIAAENRLADRRDVVNIRFDRKGRAVLVAVSDDVNFCPIPATPEDRDAQAGGTWRYTTAAVILGGLGTDWDRSRLLLFPLSGLDATPYSRHDTERAIGNHLLQSGECPLLDKFSHCY